MFKTPSEETAAFCRANQNYGILRVHPGTCSALWHSLWRCLWGCTCEKLIARLYETELAVAGKPVALSAHPEECAGSGVVCLKEKCILISRKGRVVVGDRVTSDWQGKSFMHCLACCFSGQLTVIKNRNMFVPLLKFPQMKNQLRSGQ